MEHPGKESPIEGQDELVEVSVNESADVSLDAAFGVRLHHALDQNLVLQVSRLAIQPSGLVGSGCLLDLGVLENNNNRQVFYLYKAETQERIYVIRTPLNPFGCLTPSDVDQGGSGTAVTVAAPDYFWIFSSPANNGTAVYIAHTRGRHLKGSMVPANTSDSDMQTPAGIGVPIVVDAPHIDNPRPGDINHSTWIVQVL
jgi:hypothetical protein